MAGEPTLGTAYLRVAGDFSQVNSQLVGLVSPKNMGKLGKAAGVAFAGGLAAAGAVKALYEIGETFDNVTDKIRIETGATGKQLNRLKGDFKNVFGALPTDAESAGTAIAGLNQRLDLTGKPLRRLSKQMLELSRITGEDIGTLIPSVTRAFGDWEVKTRKQTKTMDFFFRASQASGASVSQLTDLIVQFGAPLRRFGFTVEEATSMFGLFEKAGVNIQTMIPGLKLALSSFLEAGRDPEKALQKTFEGIADGSIKAADAIDIFGKRAGADMVEAISQGRFEFEEFTKVIADGDDTIRGAGRETMDFSEHWLKFKNNVLLELEPVATRVFNEIGDGMKRVTQIMTDKDLTRDEQISKIADLGADALKDLIDKAAEIGPKVAGAFLRAFASAWWDADILGKLFTAAVFVRLIGGKGALGKIGVALGTKIGLAMGPVLAAEGAAATTAGSAAGGWKTAGGKIGRLMGVGILLSAPLWIKPLGDMLNDHLGGVLGDKDRLDLTGDSPIFTPEGGTGMTLDQLEAPDWEKKLGLKDFEKTRKQIDDGHRDLWGDITRQTGRGSDDTEDRTQTNHQRVRDGFEDTRRKLDDVTRKQAQDVGGNVNRMVDAVGEGLQTLGSNTNKALQAFGAKKVGFSIEKAANTIGSFAGKQKGGSVVPGSGSGDKVFSGAWTEPNEGLFVLNRNAMGAYQHFNDLFPRFPGRQAGGWVDPAGPGTGVVNPAIAGVVGKWSQRYDAAINYGFDPGGGHVSPGHNVTGTATDTGPAAGWLAGPTALFERGLRSLVSAGLQVLYGTGGIGTPFPNHGRGNHAHIEWGSNPGAIGMAEQIARMVLNGPDGPLKSIGQGALDKPWRAAKAMLLKQMTVTGGGDLGSFGAAGTLGKSQLTSLWSGANSFGNPNLMAAIALAESGGNPAAHGPPDGRGLWQIEWPIWGSTLGHFGNPYSPMPNAKMAGEILKQQGLGAWVVYNTGAHQQFLQKGGEIPSFHDGGIFRAKRPGGEGLAMLRDREIVSTQHDIGHLRKRLRDDGLDNKDRRRLELQIELLKTIVAQNAEAQRERKAIRRQGDQTKRLNRQEVARFLSEELGAGLGQAGSRRALGTAGSGSVGRY